MQIVDKPTALPGSCRACGSASKAWYIDTGYSEEYHGAIYYCCECLAGMARLAGYITPEDAEKLQARTDQAETDAFNLRLQLTGMEQAINGLRSAGFVWSPSGDAGSVSEGVSEPSQGSDAAASGGEADVGSGEGTAPESGNDEGVGNLRPDAIGTGGFALDL